MEVELFPLFGGYIGYMKAPRWKTYRHELRWQAEKHAQADRAAQDEERHKEAERLRGGR